MKRVILICLLALVVSFYVTNVYAMCGMCGTGGAHTKDESTSSKTEEESKTVAVKNRVCPVTGDKIDEKSKASYTYKGKVYDFCCPMCIDEFKKDPQKYIKKIEKQGSEESKTKTKPKEEHQHNH